MSCVFKCSVDLLFAALVNNICSS